MLISKTGSSSPLCFDGFLTVLFLEDLRFDLDPVFFFDFFGSFFFEEEDDGVDIGASDQTPNAII